MLPSTNVACQVVQHAPRYLRPNLETAVGDGVVRRSLVYKSWRTRKDQPTCSRFSFKKKGPELGLEWNYIQVTIDRILSSFYRRG